ncbi:MAG: hypothetical protein WD733_14080 [Bryobacterales bacterium]
MMIVALILLSTVALAQETVTGPATTKGTCSPANTGHITTFTFVCGIGKEQGEQMLRILNRILAEQLDPSIVMEKLDEIHTDVRRIRDNQGWLDLTDDEIVEIAEATRAFAGQAVVIDVPFWERDTERLARQIERALTAAQWEVSVTGQGEIRFYPANAKLPKGLVVSRREDTPAFVSLSQSLGRLFGVEFVSVFRDTALADDALKITVWRKP